jgi:hypothetical protein
VARAQHGALRGPDDRRAARNMAPRYDWTDSERALEALLPEAATMDWREHELKALPQGGPAEREHERALPRRGGPVARRSGWLSREGTLTTLEARGTCKPRGNCLGGNSRVEEAF